MEGFLPITLRDGDDDSFDGDSFARQSRFDDYADDTTSIYAIETSVLSTAI